MKIKVTKISNNKIVLSPIHVNHPQLEYIHQYKFPGYWFTNQLDYKQEIRKIIELTQQRCTKCEAYFVTAVLVCRHQRWYLSSLLL